MRSSTHNSIEAIEQQEAADKTLFGFWVYIMTDCVLFASLFAAYAVLRNNTYGGPNAMELFSMPFVLSETLILLTSSFTCGLTMLALQRRDKRAILMWLAATLLLGMSFLGLELHEFTNLVQEGHSWKVSGFLTSFFTLVATHGLHITAGLIWISAMLIRVKRLGVTPATAKQIAIMSLFWHFLDIVWIFIFTIVYLMGAA